MLIEKRQHDKGEDWSPWSGGVSGAYAPAWVSAALANQSVKRVAFLRSDGRTFEYRRVVVK